MRSQQQVADQPIARSPSIDSCNNNKTTAATQQPLIGVWPRGPGCRVDGNVELPLPLPPALDWFWPAPAGTLFLRSLIDFWAPGCSLFHSSIPPTAIRWACCTLRGRLQLAVRNLPFNPRVRDPRSALRQIPDFKSTARCADAYWSKIENWSITSYESQSATSIIRCKSAHGRGTKDASKPEPLVGVVGAP